MSTESKIDNSIEAKFRNIQLEYQTLAYLTRQNPATSLRLRSEWFTCEPLEHIYNTVRKTPVVFTRESLIQQMKSEGYVKSENISVYQEYVDSIFSEDISMLNTKSIEVLINQVYELYESRNILFGVKSIVKNIKNFKLKDAKNVLKTLSQYTDLTSGDRSGDYLEDYEERKEEIKKRKELNDSGESVGVKTGILELDLTIGGLMKGEFGVIGGQPAIGKTAMLIELGIHAWLNGLNVYFASGEMGKSPIQFRMDSHIAGISAQKFRLGTLDKKDFEKWDKKIEILRACQPSFFEVGVYNRHFTSDLVEAEMLRVQDKYKKQIDLLIIDYLNIMQSNDLKNKSAKDWTAQADAVWDLKTLVGEFNGGIVGWTAGQLKDEYLDADVLSLEALKYARAISETSPIVIGLVRSQEDKLFNTMQVQVLKMRNAPPPMYPIILHPDLNLMRMNREIHHKTSLLEIDEDRILGQERQANAKKSKKRRG